MISENADDTESVSTSLQNRPNQRGEAHALPTIGVEIQRAEPLLERCMQRGPFFIDGGGRALHFRREMQMTDLDATTRWRDAQVTRQADGFAVPGIDDGEEKRITRAALLLQPRTRVFKHLKRPVGQISPARGMRIERSGIEKLLSMLSDIQRLQSDILSDGVIQVGDAITSIAL